MITVSPAYRGTGSYSLPVCERVGVTEGSYQRQFPAMSNLFGGIRESYFKVSPLEALA